MAGFVVWGYWYGDVDLNSIFNLDTGSLISIPDAVGKYLTYVLILHVVGEFRSSSAHRR